MTPLDVKFLRPDDVAWSDLHDEVPVTGQIRLAIGHKMTAKGRPGVLIRFDMSDNSVVIGQTSARLFCSAAKMIMARYPDLFEDA